MKYRILSFILVILLAGCTGKQSDEDKSLTSSDSIPQITKAASLMDSVRDAGLRKLLAADSIDLLDVKHIKVDTLKVEQLLYIDYRANTKNLAFWKGWIKNLQYGFSYFAHSDTIPHNLNPLPTLNGPFRSVHIYQGQLVFTDEDDIDIILDSALLIANNGPGYWLYYKSGKQKDGVTTYSLESANQADSYVWEIKKIKSKYDLQIWKKTSSQDVVYEVRIPFDKCLGIPSIHSANNVGEEFELPFKFDKINYDSLMNSK